MSDKPRNISREWDEIHAERDALRAENKRLMDLHEQASYEAKDAMAKAARFMGERDALGAEIERLNQALDMVAEERDAWRSAFHRAHEVRGESLMACPLCQK